MRVPQVVTAAEELRNKEGKLEEAIRLLKEHEKTSSKQDLPFVKHELGVILHDAGHFENALKKHKEALASSREVNNVFIEADSLRRMGWEYWVRDQDFEKTLKYQNQAWNKVKDNLDNPYFQSIGANIWAAIGNVHFVGREYSKSLNSYNKAMELAKKCEFNERVCTLKGDMANVYLEQHEFLKAKILLEEMYEFAKDNYRHSVPASLIRLSRLYLLNEYEGKDLLKAEKLLEEALTVVQTENWRRDEAEVYDGLYSLYLKKGDKKLAEESKIKAIQIYSELGMEHRIKNLERSN